MEIWSENNTSHNCNYKLKWKKNLHISLYIVVICDFRFIRRRRCQCLCCSLAPNSSFHCHYTYKWRCQNDKFWNGKCLNCVLLQDTSEISSSSAPQRYVATYVHVFITHNNLHWYTFSVGKLDSDNTVITCAQRALVTAPAHFDVYSGSFTQMPYLPEYMMRMFLNSSEKWEVTL